MFTCACFLTSLLGHSRLVHGGMKYPVRLHARWPWGHLVPCVATTQKTSFKKDRQRQNSYYKYTKKPENYISPSATPFDRDEPLFLFFLKYYLGGLFKSLLVFLQIEQWRTYRKRVGRERAGEGPSKDPSRNRTCVGRAAAKCCTVSATVGLGHYLSRPTCSIDSIGQLQ